MRLNFFGAAGTVTGSRYLLEVAGRRILLDCGLFQGLKQLRLRNREPFPVDPASLDAVVLTHAHLDHTGYLPLLIRTGFRGPVHCTAATADLCAVLLPDSGRLQEEDAAHAARGGYSRHAEPQPLYTESDAMRALEQLQAAPLGEPLPLGGGLSMLMRPAGHLLGATTVTFTSAEGSVLFSGDLGRPNDPLLRPPVAVPEGADVVVVESTYGDRIHEAADPAERLAEVIGRTTARGGTVVIPAFAVGRAQAMLYYIHQLKEAGRIPRSLPVFLDSPMAEAATRVFLAHAGDTRLTPAECAAVAHAAEPTSTVAASKRIGRMREPRIIVAASGMATGGRVLHHLAQLAPDPRNTILFAGYQAAGTRGAELVAGAREVKIHGERVEIRAEVTSLPNASGHADAREILSWLGAVRPESAPRQVFITHGEPVAADALRRRIEGELGWSCRVPEHRESAELAPRPEAPAAEPEAALAAV